MALPGFRYSPLGLRDGVLAQMLGETSILRAERPSQDRDRTLGRACSPCASATTSTSARLSPYGYMHVQAVRRSLQRVHELPPEYRLWLEAAAMMHEVGKFMNHQGHHRHTQYILANSEIFGFSPEQRLIVAAIARYLGKSRPDAMDRPMRAVPIEEHAHVAAAVVLLRLAVALNQDRASAAVQVKLRSSIPSACCSRFGPGAAVRRSKAGRSRRKRLTSARSCAASSSSRLHRAHAPCVDRVRSVASPGPW